MKINFKIFEILLLFIIPVLVTIAVYPNLPETVAVHFNFEFRPDGFAPKGILFLLPAYLFGIEIIVYLVQSRVKSNSKQNARVLNIILWMIPVLLVFSQFSILYYTVYKSSSFVHTIPLIVGIFFILLGNLTPKMQPNKYIGIRLPWTRDRNNWKKTNRVFAVLQVLLGFIFIFAAIIKIPATLIISSIILTVLIPVLYSYRLYKSERR